MENQTMTVTEALNYAINMLDEVEVKGFKNTSRISDSQKLIAKAVKYLEDQAVKQNEAPEIRIEPMEPIPAEKVPEVLNGGEAE